MTTTATNPETVSVSDTPFSASLPEENHGWVRAQTELGADALFEYWRATSSHVVGAYEQLVASRLRDGDIQLSRHVFDQFRHRVSSQTITTRSADQADWIWGIATERMKTHPGNGKFTSPPTVPTSVNGWEAASPATDNPRRSRWERDGGRAALIAEQTGIEGHYSHTTRRYDIRYSEPNSQTREIVTGVPRTRAFEIALVTLKALPAPLSELEDRQERLQSTPGIGPAKSRQFILLGITSKDDLAEHVTTDENLINHHHSEALEKQLTSTITTAITKQE